MHESELEILTRTFCARLEKPSLLLTLMEMLATADTERANHVTKGLIAKTLLEESWCGDSLLVYIDLIR